MRGWHPLLLLLLALFALAGCEAPRVSRSIDTTLGGGDFDSQISFWHTLNGQALTSNDDAAHGLLLFFDGHDDSTTYDQRVARLRQLGLLPSSFHGAANQAVQRGTVAYAAVKGLHIQGGWVMTLFGVTPRYAIRQLEYLNLFPPSSPQQLLAGAEFVGIIGKLQDYQEKNPIDLPATQLPPPTRPPLGGAR